MVNAKKHKEIVKNHFLNSNKLDTENFICFSLKVISVYKLKNMSNNLQNNISTSKISKTDPGRNKIRYKSKLRYEIFYYINYRIVFSFFLS
jgi:hypothetical protein